MTVENTVTEKKRGKSGVIKNIVIAILSVAVVAMTVVVIVLSVNRNDYKTTLENVYQRSFYELMEASNQVENNLCKMLAASSDIQNASLTMETYNNAETALSSISALPGQRTDVQAIEKYFNQVADWSMSYNRSISNKRNLLTYENQIEDLYIASREINKNILEESVAMQESGYDLISIYAQKDKDAKNGTTKKSNTMEGEEEKTFKTVDYPELIYDGPFSESTSKRAYKALEGLEEINCESAMQIVKDNIEGVATVECLGESAGMAETFDLMAYTGANKTGMTYYCSVTKKGGKFLNISTYREVQDAKLTESVAKEAAVKIAAKFGYDVQPVWYNNVNGVALVNMAPIIDDVIFYTDIIKVKVALDNGEMLGVEALSFCMNHNKRSYTPTMTESAAKSMIRKKLDIKSASLAVVPDGQTEVLCYMIAAEYKGLDYFVFIDAHDGREVNIMRVIDDNQGKLVV